MDYFFEHPILEGIVPIEDKKLIESFNSLKLKEGQKVVLKSTQIYVKSISAQDNMTIFSKDKK